MRVGVLAFQMLESPESTSPGRSLPHLGRFRGLFSFSECVARSSTLTYKISERPNTHDAFTPAQPCVPLSPNIHHGWYQEENRFFHL